MNQLSACKTTQYDQISIELIMIVHNILMNYLNLIKELIQKQLITGVLKNKLVNFQGKHK